MFGVLDAEAKRAKINRMKRKSERDARNPSQARARSNWTEAKKLNPQRETLTVKQSYVRQKTTTKCLAGDMVVLEQKFDVCQLELKAAKKQIEVRPSFHRFSLYAWIYTRSDKSYHC